LIQRGVIGSAVYSSATTSTNRDAVAELQSREIGEALLPRVYLTDRQTAGRGRHGKLWISDDDSLTLSFVVDLDRMHRSASLVSPAIGVAVARAIEFSCAPCHVALKWPNDICTLVAERSGSAPELRKLGGILIETAASIDRRLVIGIGLNLNRRPDLDSPEVTPPASLADLSARSVRREDLLTVIAESITETLRELRADTGDLLRQFRSRCALTGKDLSLRQNDQIITGRCTGITDDGSLELMVDDQRRHFRSGEVHRVRAV
jgi:BirA family biotin operon repressor/biotin-[acetyl-CoA-carboxylase] ligase